MVKSAYHTSPIPFRNLSSGASIRYLASAGSLSKSMATADIVGTRIPGLDLRCLAGRVLHFYLRARHEKRLLDSCIQVDFG